ncbi:MAG: HAD family hydrolase [Blautia sp.]|nr:HAD family hydrolase [Blautia sp.]MCM1202006.1 HAD family hydrolase [Bacteroides fragilis]
MKLYRDYIFDLYGTLVDIRTNEKEHALWKRMSLFYGYYGAPYMPEELEAAYGALVLAKEKGAESREKKSGENGKLYAHESYPEISIEEVFRELYTERGVDPPEELVVHTGQMFRALSTRHLRLYAGAKELLRKLHEKGRRVYLLSNAQRIFTERELRYLQIEDCFDGILISSDYGVKKPDAEFFRILTEKYRIEPGNALMIGNDPDSDIAGAKRAGMDTFYIHSAISPKNGRKPDADYRMMKMDLRNLCRQLMP